MLKTAAGTAALLCAGALAAAAPAAADETAPPDVGTHQTPPTQSSSAHSAGDGSIAVTVESSYSSPGGHQAGKTVSVRVQPQCYLRMGKTGYDYYEYWKDGSDALTAPTLSDYKYQGLLNKGWDDPKIAADKDGHWYDPFCNFGADKNVSDKYYRTTDSVFVEPGDPLPTAQATVDPETLLEAMTSVMTLPRGTIGRNPIEDVTGAALVGFPTWVWVDDVPTLTMTASIPSGARADLIAKVHDITVSADNADSVGCTGAGTPWTAAAEKSGGEPCEITFSRSSAKLAGGTARLTVAAQWAATWTTNLRPGVQTVKPPPPVTQTVRVPVAESQAVVTH